MGLPEEIAKLLKSEGYRINESIQDAISDFIETVNEENEEMEDGIEDDRDLGGDDEIEGPEGLKADR